MVFLEEVKIDTREGLCARTNEAVDPAHGGESYEVAVALEVFGKEGEVESVGGVVVVSIGGDVCVHPDDGFDAVFLSMFLEVDSAEHGAMVSHGDSVHSELFNARHQFVDTDGAIEKGVLCVDM